MALKLITKSDYSSKLTGFFGISVDKKRGKVQVPSAVVKELGFTRDAPFASILLDDETHELYFGWDPNGEHRLSFDYDSGFSGLLAGLYPVMARNLKDLDLKEQGSTHIPITIVEDLPGFDARKFAQVLWPKKPVMSIEASFADPISCIGETVARIQRKPFYAEKWSDFYTETKLEPIEEELVDQGLVLGESVIKPNDLAKERHEIDEIKDRIQEAFTADDVARTVESHPDLSEPKKRDQNSPIDWKAIRSDFENGVTKADLIRKCGINKANLYDRSQKEDWRQKTVKPKSARAKRAACEGLPKHTGKRIVKPRGPVVLEANPVPIVDRSPAVLQPAERQPAITPINGKLTDMALSLMIGGISSISPRGFTAGTISIAVLMASEGASDQKIADVIKAPWGTVGHWINVLKPHVVNLQRITDTDSRKRYLGMLQKRIEVTIS